MPISSANEPRSRRPQARTVRTRTWYGLEVAVHIPARGLHRAGLPGLLLVHPPVTNWLLRRHLADEARMRLAESHELGHLQALPVELAYGGLLLGIGALNGQLDPLGLAILFISCLATWEILAELHTRWRLGASYQAAYRGVSLLPRALFWCVTGLLTLLGWIVAAG